MKTTKAENRVSEQINTIENARKLAKEQENPSYTKMFLPWVEQVAEQDRVLYSLGLVDKLPNLTNTTNRVNSFVVKVFTFVQQYAKRSNELARKERALNAAVTKFGITREQAEQMYLAGMLKL